MGDKCLRWRVRILDFLSKGKATNSLCAFELALCFKCYNLNSHCINCHSHCVLMYIVHGNIFAIDFLCQLHIMILNNCCDALCYHQFLVSIAHATSWFPSPNPLLVFLLNCGMDLRLCFYFCFAICFVVFCFTS